MRDMENRNKKGKLEISASKTGLITGTAIGALVTGGSYVSNAIEGCYGYGPGCIESPTSLGVVTGITGGILTYLFTKNHQRRESEREIRKSFYPNWDEKK